MDNKQLTKAQWHKSEAVNNFNGTWDLMDKKDRSKDEDALMIHKAHASRYHWEQVEEGTSLNLARGDWQVSRVYSVLAMGEMALYHGQRSLDICLKDGYGDFDLAFGYEAVARAYDLIGDTSSRDENLNLAKEAAAKIKKKDDRDYFLSELNTISQ